MKVNRAIPIPRGNMITYGYSHSFLGIIITTNMPDINEDEYNWFFRYIKRVDPERIIKIVQAAGVRNDLVIFLSQEQRENRPPPLKLKRLKRDIEYYDRALLKLRRGQAFFLNASSFASVEILTMKYLERLYSGTLKPHEFKKSVAGIRPDLHRDLCFYVLFGGGHKYYNDTMFGEAVYSSRELRYLYHDKAIEGGMDFGNMLSSVIDQPDGAYYRVHKDFFEIPPGWFREIADQFPTFFQNHEYKELGLFYDRADNNFEKQEEDYASKIKDVIEKNGSRNRTGWAVNPRSHKWAVIRQDAEYDFMQELIGGTSKNLPILLVGALDCREMTSSVERVKAKIKCRGNSKVVFKVKESEKLTPKKLSMLPTDLSDAFKYSLMRPGWIALVRGKRMLQANSFVGQWIESRHKR